MPCRHCYYFSDYYNDEGEGYCSQLHMRVQRGSKCNHFVSNAEVEQRKKEEAEKSAGYKEGCFLTSACVNYLDKSDNCEELTKLRTFRDEYIKGLVGGQKIIDDYYAVAPTIVQKIDNSSNPDEYYQYIYRVIIDCIECIDNGANEDALSKYKSMVVLLKDKFKV